jgi:hypothetical protein
VAADRAPLDAYSPLDHYMAVSGASRAPVASWVPEEDRRRLSAYYVRDSYRKNKTSRLLRRASWVRRQKQREYGDASLLLSRIRTGVLGEDFEFVLPGADDDLGDAPDLPPRPDPIPDDADEIDKRMFTVAEARWKDLANRTIDEWEQAAQDQPFLQERQQAIRQWADRILLAALMVEAEDDCVGLGDTVYALFPQPGDWPRVEIYEPDGYFPVLGTKRDGYPTKVHLAWEIEEKNPDGSIERFVERYTWELVDIASRLPVGEVEDEAIRETRRYPWAETEEGEEGTVSSETCIFTRGKWKLDGTTFSKVPDLSDEAAEDLEQVDLECDFLPFLHIPNAPSSRDHFGPGPGRPVARRRVPDGHRHDGDRPARRGPRDRPLRGRGEGPDDPAPDDLQPGQGRGDDPPRPVRGSGEGHGLPGPAR